MAHPPSGEHGSHADAFSRGAEAGEIRERLASHDRHFASINGSLGKVATEMHEMTLAVQRLGDQAVSAAATTVATAEALRAANAARQERAEAAWSPWQKIFAVLAALATAVGLYVALKPLG